MKTLVLLIATFFWMTPVSQEMMKVDSEKTQLTIFGTSSIHDWEIEAEDCVGEAKVIFDEAKFSTIEMLTFKVAVDKLKSGKDAMDDNTVEALKGKKYPYITYELIELKPMGDKYQARGKLTVAGTTRTINMSTEIKSINNAIKVTGDITFKMTDFNVDPPTAVFGTIKTGDEVTIKFNTTFKN